jgi:hypothetical protein
MGRAYWFEDDSANEMVVTVDNDGEAAIVAVVVKKDRTE